MGPRFFFNFSKKPFLQPVSPVKENHCTVCEWNRETLSVSFVSDDASQRILKLLNSKTPRDPHLTKAGLFRSCWDPWILISISIFILMGDLLQGSGSPCPSPRLRLWQCRETLSEQFSGWKATFAFKINGPGKLHSPLDKMLSSH